MSMDNVNPMDLNPASFAPGPDAWFDSEPGSIIFQHPSLARFAPWLRHLWENGDLEPSGPIVHGMYREGVDPSTGICVEYAAAPLPVLPPPPLSPTLDTLDSVDTSDRYIPSSPPIRRSSTIGHAGGHSTNPSASGSSHVPSTSTSTNASSFAPSPAPYLHATPPRMTVTTATARPETSRQNPTPTSTPTPTSMMATTPIPTPHAHHITVPPPPQAPQATLLAEYIGVVQLRFFLPPCLRHLLLVSQLILGMFILVRIPTISWHEGSFSRIDVFEALCREISSACIGVEARCDWLIYRTIDPLRKRVFRELQYTMETVSHRAVDIAPYWAWTDAHSHTHSYSPTRAQARAFRAYHRRRLYSYDPHEQQMHFPTSPAAASGTGTGALILHQNDPGGGSGHDFELGLAIWARGELSFFPSHTSLFRVVPSKGRPRLGITPPRLAMGAANDRDGSGMLAGAVNAARACLFHHCSWSPSSPVRAPGPVVL